MKHDDSADGRRKLKVGHGPGADARPVPVNVGPLVFPRRDEVQQLWGLRPFAPPAPPPPIHLPPASSRKDLWFGRLRRLQAQLLDPTLPFTEKARILRRASNKLLRTARKKLRRASVPAIPCAAPVAPPFDRVQEWIAHQQLARQTLVHLYEHSLRLHLACGVRLSFPTPSEIPIVSVVLVLFNRAELTFQCLRSLHEIHDVPMEVIVIDNNSTDATHALLASCDGLRVVLNSENVNYLAACQQAAALASGECLLLLNNDAQLMPGAITTAVRTLRSAPNIGAVGGQVILLEGVLQEAGSMVWQDGICRGYGRLDLPFSPEYMFQRDVDYCSGVFLLTPTALFRACGGYDEDYKPAYYEDVDYCLRLRERGKRVVYEPDAVVIHFESASSAAKCHAVALMEQNRQVLCVKHETFLQEQLPSQPTDEVRGRCAGSHCQKRVLLIEDFVPHERMGAGFPRSNAMVHALVDDGWFVTLFPSLPFPNVKTDSSWGEVYSDIPRTVEVMTGLGYTRLEEFLAGRPRYYHAVVVSRPHNMRIFRDIRARHAEWFENVRIVYDAEAIYSLREVMQHELAGVQVPTAQVQAMVRDEVGLAEGAHQILTVSSGERKHFVRHGYAQVEVLSHGVAIAPALTSFEERRDFLFVGPIRPQTPNEDSLLWFLQDVLPHLRATLAEPAHLLHVGEMFSPLLRQFGDECVRWLGLVPDLHPCYAAARLFIAPTRYGAGIPLKVVQAAAHGVPVVATPLVAEQLNWTDGRELLVAADAETFARCCRDLYQNEDLWKQIRWHALQRVQKEHSPQAFRQSLRRALRHAG